MKPVDLNSFTYIVFNKENNKEDPKFEVGYLVRISSKLVWRIFVIKTIKNTVPWTYVINDLNDEKIIGTFYKEELQKPNQKEFKVKKVIKGKGDKLHVK